LRPSCEKVLAATRNISPAPSIGETLTVPYACAKHHTAIPAATDIAFALGILALVGSALPSGVRVFLLSLAVVDDLVAIAIIAVLFTASIDLIAAGLTVLLLASYAFLQHKRIRTPWLYIPIALGSWVAMHATGVPATVAGIALGLLTRVRRDPGEPQAPAVRLEHRLQPWSAGVVVPAFALFAAGIPIDSASFNTMFSNPVALAILAGLLVGKFVGIFGFSVIAVRLQLATKPRRVSWLDMVAISVLGGVGFTISLLIADLALAGQVEDQAKVAVLLASAVASLVAAGLLVHRNRTHREQARQ